MLGVFQREGNKPDPTAPEWPGPEYIPALKDGYLEKYFASVYSFPVIVNFGNYGFLAYSADKKISPGPRALFGLRDGIYCVYRGSAERLKKVDHKGNEADLIIASYRVVKKTGNKTPLDIMENLGENHNYILYDCSGEKECDMKGAFAANCLKNIPLYSGLDSEGSCIISDDINIMKKVCGNSFKPIPKGNGLLIPVLAAPKVGEDDFWSTDSNSDDESLEEEETIEVNPLYDGRSRTESQRQSTDVSCLAAKSPKEEELTEDTPLATPEKVSAGESIAASPPSETYNAE